jgi:hypothetical protein
MIVKMPGKVGAGVEGWFAFAGENWQVPFASHPMWDPTKSSGSPSAKNDCETKMHYIVCTFLSICALVQESAKNPVGVMKDFKEAVYTHMDMPSVMPSVMQASCSSSSSYSKAPPAAQYNGSRQQVAAADQFCRVMYVAFKTLALKGEMMGILGKAWGAAAGDEGRTVGGHAYPAIQFKNQDGSVAWAMGEGTAAVFNRGHYMHASQGDSNMAFQQGHALVLMDEWMKRYTQVVSQITPATQNNTTQNNTTKIGTDKSNTYSARKVSFNGIMYQSEIEHTDKFYGEALVSSNAMLYSKHHDTKTDKPLDNCKPFGSLWFTKNKADGKLSFGGCPEDPYKKDVIFADISGKLVDSMLPKDLVSSGTNFTSLQQQTVHAVREYAGRRIPEAHWDTWINRMHAKGMPGDFQRMHPMPIPFQEAGKVFRVVVTFENAEALKQFKAPISSAWNPNSITPAIMIQKTQAQMDDIQAKCAEWRSSPQMRSKMKCLAHTKKCYEEWQENKKARFAFACYETLNCLILTLSCNVPVRGKVFDMFLEEAKKPVDKPKAVDPFVVGKPTSTSTSTSSTSTSMNSTSSTSMNQNKQVKGKR